jgi:phospholipase C
MMIPPRLTRHNFLQLLFTIGGGLATTGLLRALQKVEPPTSSPYYDRIKNIIFFIQENHSFDNLFAGFPGADSKFAQHKCPDALRKDPPHNHADALQPDGATSEEARCSYTEANAPNYWKAARAFTLCDHYFSEIRGASIPNFLMMVAAQSPMIDPPSNYDICPDLCLDLPVLPHRLDAHGLTWREYGGLFTIIKSLAGRSEITAFEDEQFFQDAADGTLPNVAWLFSGLLKDANNKSGHPPASLCTGENYAVSVLNAVMNGPQWSSTVLFLVWDDWGGFYDHMEPPTVEPWKDGTPYRYGHRVPCLVISPYARSGYVSHALYSHVSLLHFAERILGLEPLTERDANASDMLDCFDFEQPALPPLVFTQRECT